MMPPIPASILSDVLTEAAREAPTIVGGIVQALAAQGFDLGPMTPNVREDFARVDAVIDAELTHRKAP
jgi:hypothetical protein